MIDKLERVTQDRVVKLLQSLGYDHLGNWQRRIGNSNIEEERLTHWLAAQGYSEQQISGAIFKLKAEAHNPQRDLYDNNYEVYQLLRYGVPVKAAAGENTETIRLIDWEHPENNDFAVAEEVTLQGDSVRRPDVALYINGIAFAAIELKNSRTSIGDGIGQLLSNQRPEFHPWFFSTVQYLFAGSDSEGLKYGTTLTPAKLFLAWKEDTHENNGYKLDKYLRKLCNKARIIDLMHDFVLFDNRVKKVPRPHQYFGVKAAQEHIKANGTGGIIWHSQGSGKSIVMVLMAKWILENHPNGRVIIVTDRDELDEQIEGVFRGSGEDKIYRAQSGHDLLAKLALPSPRLMCTLVHKYHTRDVENFEQFIKDLKDHPSQTVGDVFVFVDEAHRTQDRMGKLHRAMRATMPQAVFMGFTGTPLLTKDRATTLEVFGGYIHTYKYSEAVEDGVVLDMVYEARDVDQQVLDRRELDAYFDAKTHNLTEWQKSELKKITATRAKLQAAKSRLEKIAHEIELDFEYKKPRISGGRGNAILVASSILEACRYYEIFQAGPLKGKVAIITSYDPQSSDVTREEMGTGSETDRQYIKSVYTKLLTEVQAVPGKSKAETYVDKGKEQFVKDPNGMRLAIVVDKLLTGFDAPKCSVIYLDKPMKDHGLFQAICRTNRVDEDDKAYGVIVDYKGLMEQVKGAIAVYSSEIDDVSTGTSEIFIKDVIRRAKERVEDAVERLFVLCEPVEAPRDDLAYQRYFCGNTEIESDLEATRHRREELYRGIAEFVRSVANFLEFAADAGYTPEQIARLNRDRDFYANLRALIKNASGEFLDIKPFEADMRYMIDTFVSAESRGTVFTTEDTGLLALMNRVLIHDVPASTQGRSEDAAAETIENNARKRIIAQKFSDPVYYEKMSALLNELIEQRKARALQYEEYLARMRELATQIDTGKSNDTPAALDSKAKIAFFNYLNDEALALKVDAAIKAGRPDAWRGDLIRERMVKSAIRKALDGMAYGPEKIEQLFEIAKAQADY